MNRKEHLLVCLNEEGIESFTEASKLCDKALRFGLDNVNILHPDGPNNRERLVDELNDIMGVIELMVELEMIPADWQSREKIEAKKIKVAEFMGYSEDLGTLSP